MRRVLIKIEYSGKHYAGWQIQKGLPTVQGTLRDALEKLLGHAVKLEGSSRTDCGVHAAANAAHFDTDTEIPTERLPYAVNFLLPPDIRVQSAEVVPNTFHARYDAGGKTYEYRMYVSRHASPLREDFAVRLINAPDAALMNEACRYLVGEHDFTSFRASNSDTKGSVRTVFSAEVFEREDCIIFRVSGSGFLYNMVRIAAGTLVDIGLKKYEPAKMAEIIAARDRKCAGKTLAAKGLCLLSVDYGEKNA